MCRIPRTFSGLCHWGDCAPFTLRSHPPGPAAVGVSLLKPQFSDRGPGPSGVREPPLGAATGGDLCVPLTVRSGSESLGRALVRGRALARGGYCQGAGPARGRALAGAGPRGGGALAAPDRPVQRSGGDAVWQAVGLAAHAAPGTQDEGGQRMRGREAGSFLSRSL